MNERTLSPRYPSSDLRSCIEKLTLLYRKEGKAPTPRIVASTALGFKGMSGASGRLLSSLTQFGMIADAGSGTVKITDLGLALVMPADNQEFAIKAQESLDRPKIFKVLDTQFGDSGSAESLAVSLARHHGFNSNAANECAKSYKSSINYVRSLPGFIKNPINEVIESTQHEVNHSKSITPEATIDASFSLSTNSEIKTGKLSDRTKIDVIVTGPLGVSEEEKLKTWMEKVLTKWLEVKATNDQFNEDDNE